MSKKLDMDAIKTIVEKEDRQKAQTTHERTKWPDMQMRRTLLAAINNGDQYVTLEQYRMEIVYPKVQPFDDGERHVLVRNTNPKEFAPLGWFSVNKLAKDS